MSQTQEPEWELYVGREQMRSATVEELIECLEQQRLNPGDRVRHIASDQWYEADDLGPLLQEARNRTGSSSSNSPTAARTAADVLDRLSQARTARLNESRSVGREPDLRQPKLEERKPPQPARDRQGGWPAKFVQLVVRLTIAPVSRLCVWCASGLSVRKIRRSWISVAVILALLCGSILWQFLPDRVFSLRTEQRVLASYEALWKEYAELSSRSADRKNAAEWAAYAARANEINQVIVAQLESRANVKNRSAQQLLWAGRDCFPTLLGGTGDRSTAEAEFLKHLETAKSLMQASDPALVLTEPPPTKEQMEDAVRNATAWEHRHAIRVAQESYLERSVGQDETDWWTVAIITSDVSIVGLLGAWWYRRRR